MENRHLRPMDYELQRLSTSKQSLRWRQTTPRHYYQFMMISSRMLQGSIDDGPKFGRSGGRECHWIQLAVSVKASHPGGSRYYQELGGPQKIVKGQNICGCYFKVGIRSAVSADDGIQDLLDSGIFITMKSLEYISMLH